MNSAQRRKTYRAMTKLMREDTPIRVRAPWPNSPQRKVVTKIGAVFYQQGVIQVVEEFTERGHRYYPTGRIIPARYVEPVPRCWRTTL